MKKISKFLLALTIAFSVSSSAYAVVVASWGGAYANSQKLGYGDPTAEKLGIPIDWVDYSGGLSEITAQKEIAISKRRRKSGPTALSNNSIALD